MKSLWINLILVAALIVAANNPSMAQTPEQLYQKGLMKEEGEGELQDAIDLYSQVADNSNADQSLRAKALLHIGMCYEKLGTREAVEVYQRLVNNFPAQKNEVAIARERLSRLTTTESPREIAIRQVWTGQEADGFGSVSADGQYLSFADWGTGNLAVRNLKTGYNKQVTNDATWKDSTQFVEYSLISPDGNKFAYTWYNKNINYELRLIKNGSQEPLTLYSCKNFDEYIIPGVWFSEGNRIIAQKYDNIIRIWQLLSINTSSGEMEVLKEQLPGPTPGPSFMANVSLSPDEKYIAYDFPNITSNGMYDINMLSLDTKNETHLIEHPANDRLLGWLPAVNEMLFVSDRSGTKDIWALSVSDGKPASVSKRVLTDIGDIDPMGFTRKGSLFFSVLINVFESFIVPLDSENGMVSINSRTPISGQKYGCIWLPDGESMVCCQYNQGPEAQRNRNINIAVLNSKTGESRILAGNLNIIYRQLRLSPDGKSIIVFGSDEQRLNEKEYNGGIYKVDIETGRMVEVKIKQDASRSISCEWDKEGRNIFYCSNDQLIKHNLETGDEKVIYTDKGVYYPAIIRSYDGNNLLFDIRGKENNTFHLLSIPENGGDVDTLGTYKADMNPGHRRIDLSPDGKYIYLSTQAPELKSILCRIPATGGTPQNLWQSANYFISGIGIHPDGRRITLSTSGDENEKEIRSIDNLDKKVAEIFSKEE